MQQTNATTLASHWKINKSWIKKLNECKIQFTYNGGSNIFPYP